MSAPARVRAVQAKNQQSDKAKRATRELFQAKKPREDEYTIEINGDKVTIGLRAIGREAYDKLVTACPASVADRAKGETYDQAKFAPLLLARCVIDPEMTEVEWRNIWNSDEWNRAELGELFFAAVGVCSVAVTPDPTSPDSDQIPPSG